MFFKVNLKSQSYLCKENTPGWSECFFLEPNGSFEYRLYMCHPIEYGIGTFVSKNNKLIFDFDSVINPLIVKSYNDSFLNKVKISINDLKNNSQITIKYKSDSFYINNNGELTLNYNGGDIDIFTSQKITINPQDERFNEYSIKYIVSRAFSEKGKQIKFTKTRKKYYKKVPRYLGKSRKIKIGERKVFYTFKNI